MAHLRLLAILIAAIFCYATLIDTAAIRSEEFAEQLQRMALDLGPENLRTQRAIKTGGDQPVRNCHAAPCGWAVYSPFTRIYDYFMKNTCECLKSYKCVKQEDDLSASAWVYRCRKNYTAKDIAPLEDAN